MACKRSAVRSRLAPPAFARFASFGSASPEAYQARSERRLPRHSPKGDGGPGRFILFVGHSSARLIHRGDEHLESLDSEHFYIGITDDLRARLAKHNAGEVPHTSKYRPWRIRTYFAFSDEARAIAFEKYLKSGSGRAFAKKRL
jgi:putative endonuclease